jgi:hypothetical protein
MKRSLFYLGLASSWLLGLGCGDGPDEPYVAVDSEQTEGAAMCQVGGCSRQLCLPIGMGDGMASTCEWRDEYACYRGARCEVQGDGMCGWTRTDELERCLEAPPPMSEPD